MYIDWPSAPGPSKQIAAALIGQDVLSQRSFLQRSATGGPQGLPSAPSPAPYTALAGEAFGSGSLELAGVGDCLDGAGRHLQGFQKPACTQDDAAQECLAMPEGMCQGITVTTGEHSQGSCYIHADGNDAEDDLATRGWQRYQPPEGEESYPLGAADASSTGQPDLAKKKCFRVRKP